MEGLAGALTLKEWDSRRVWAFPSIHMAVRYLIDFALYLGI